MYQEGETGYIEIDEMSTSGYVINESMSYCTIDHINKDTSAKLYTDNQGQHVFSGLKKNSKCYLYFDEKAIPAKDFILMGRTAQTRNFPVTRATALTGTNGQGDVYRAPEGDGKTYYFAGNPTNNWVNFAGFYWRIIRINSDDSIRMIYAGTDPNVTTGTGTQISLDESTTAYAFNTTYDATYYVGLKYRSAQHGTTTNSTIMEVLNTWYSNHLLSYAGKLTSGTGFCGDREMDSNTPTWSARPSSAIFYAAYERLLRDTSNVVPTFDCSNNSDLYTTSGTGTGNGALQYPIGLITADEVIYAGLPSSGGTTDNYLYTNQHYWTMTPRRFNGSRAEVFRVFYNGYLDYWDVNNTIGVRPVINLSANVTLSGSGTSTDPYAVN